MSIGDNLIARYMEPLVPLLADAEDVAIQEPGVAWAYRDGSWSRHDVPELTLTHLENLAVVAASGWQQEALTNPIIDVGLPGVRRRRLHVCSAPTVPKDTISLTFRQPSDDRVAPPEDIPNRYQTDGWNRYEHRREARNRNLSELLNLYRADSPDIVRFLTACVQARLNIIFVGMTGSAKSSLVKILTAAIPMAERVITVEDVDELVIPQPNHVRLMFPRNDLVTDKITAQIELQGCWRMRPDRVFLGEIRGKEAWTFVNEVSPATPGTMSTIHGHSARSGFQRLFGLCRASEDTAGMDDKTLAAFVAASVDVIVPLHKDGRIFNIDPIWFVGDAEDKGETALDLLQ